MPARVFEISTISGQVAASCKRPEVVQRPDNRCFDAGNILEAQKSVANPMQVDEIGVHGGNMAADSAGRPGRSEIVWLTLWVKLIRQDIKAAAQPTNF